MMSAAPCSFCQHTNPPSSRFCNACGGTLYDMPCPHCGAVNDPEATVCHQCARELPERTDVAAPLLPAGARSRVAGSAGATGGGPDPLPPASLIGKGVDHDARLFATLQQLLEYSSAPADIGSSDRRSLDPPVPPGARGAATRTSDHAPRPYAVSAVGEPKAFRVEPRLIRRVRSAVILGIAVLAVAAASAYYFYRWLVDIPPTAIATENAGKGGSPVATRVLVEAGTAPSAKAPTGASSTVALTPPLGAPAPESSVPAVRPGTVTAARGDAGGPASMTRSPGADQRRHGAEGGSLPQPPAPAAPAAVARPRTSEAGPGFELQKPRLGPCTEVVAALGLCTQEPAQGRE
jgi:hypothetical protein